MKTIKDINGNIIIAHNEKGDAEGGYDSSVRTWKGNAKGGHGSSVRT